MKKLLTLLFCTAFSLNMPSRAVADDVAKSTPTATAPIVAPVAEPIPPEHKVVELHITRLIEVPDEIAPQMKAHFETREVHYLCSGAFINDSGDIITAKHCTNNANEIEVVTYDNQHFAATVKSQSDTHDLAIIHVDSSNTPHFELAKGIHRGEKIHIIGSPLGITDTLSEGLIAKIDGDHILLDCGVLPGNSGSTVFDDDGNLVGVATAGFIVGFGVTHLNIAQSLDAVRFYLKKQDSSK